MRRIAQATMMAVFLGTAALPALAQQGPLAPVAYVNNSAVTRYEVAQRVRFMQILRAPDANPETALQALIDDRLKMQAAELMGIRVTDEGLEAGLTEFAGRAGLDTAGFAAALASEGVERQAWRDFVRVNVAWREVIRQRVVPGINVSDREIEQELKQDIQTPIVTQVLLSELVIPAPPGQEAQAQAIAQRLSETVRSESQFAAAARQYSAVPTAPEGGRLPWTSIDNLAPGLREILLRIPEDSISAPLSVQGAVVLFYLRDTRGRLRAGAGDQTVEYVELALPSAAEGAQVLSVADSCDQVYVQANRFAGDVIQRHHMPLSSVPLDVAQRLASLDPDEGTVIDYGRGARLVMLCKRTPTLIDEPDMATTLPGLPAPARREAVQPPPSAADAPSAENAASDAAAAAGLSAGEPPLRSRDEVRAAIFNRKVNAAADAYLAELRADALMRRP